MNSIDFNNLEALLLDLDGTLINSEKAFFLSFKNVLKKSFNIDISNEDYTKYELEQNAMLLKTLKQRYKSIENISEQDIMKLIYEDYEHSFKVVIKESETKDNFNLLKQIKNKGIRLALVTTCRRHYIDILVKELNLDCLFEVIIAREDVANLKPSPEAYIKTLNYLKLQPQNCLAVEDSKRGVEAAIKAALPIVKVENFTALKYKDERTIEVDSANYILRKICNVNQSLKY